MVMFVAETNYQPLDHSLVDEVSYSDVENVSVSPDDHMVGVINVVRSTIEDRAAEKVVHGDESRSWTMAKVQVGYDVTRKGERSLVVDGFKFTKSRDGTNNRIFWRCSRRECKATAVTVSDKVEHVRAIHAHEPPLAAEFFGSHEGAIQHCEMQEVRFNTNAANMRPRYRRSNVSLSESNPEESAIVKDISNSTSNFRISNPPFEQSSRPAKSSHITPTQYTLHNVDIRPNSGIVPGAQQQKTASSVKEQVRDFILRNSSQMSSYPPNNGVSVAQFIISPSTQSPFLHANSGTVSSSGCNSSTVFNFNPVHISTSSNNGSDSTSDVSSYRSAPGVIQVPTTPRNDSPTIVKSEGDTAALNQMHIDQVIQLLLKSSSNRQRSTSESEWCTTGVGLLHGNDHTADGHRGTQFDSGTQLVYTGGISGRCLSPMQVTTTSECRPLLTTCAPEEYQASPPSRFVHWKKERLRDSEMCDRKRRYEDTVNTTCTQSSETDSDDVLLASFMNSFRPTITRKLMCVMHKLTSDLCPDSAAAQDVFEKCTAIKTCLETLEKLHSLTSSS